MIYNSKKEINRILKRLNKKASFKRIANDVDAVDKVLSEYSRKRLNLLVSEIL